MRKKNLVLAAALAAAAAGAQAYPTYHFEVRGSGLYAAGGTEGCSALHPEECLHGTDWRGVLTVETKSSVDGTYGIGEVGVTDWIPGGIVRVTLESNVGSVDVDGQEFPGAHFFPGSYPYAITIAGNQVTSIEWTSLETPDGGGFLHVDGFSAQFQSNTYHGTYADVTGTLTPIPEPGGISLSLLGLATVALGLRLAGVKRARGSSRVA